MDNLELYQMFFSVIQKIKYNTLKLGVKVDPKTAIEIASLIDKTTIELYRIASIENIELKYHLEQMERFSDVTYTWESANTIQEFKIAANSMIDHILKYLKEQIGIYGKIERAEIVSKLIRLSEEFYDLKLKII